MPFKSQSQRAYFYSQLPHLAKKWEAHTPKGKKLPKKVKKEEGGVSELGYKDNSPYKNAPFLDIHSSEGLITMKGVSQPLIGIDETGFQQIMMPGKDYKFKGKNIREIPLLQRGGSVYDLMQSKGMDGSYKNRKKLFNQMFDGKYEGTAEQNTQLYQMLSKPKASTNVPKYVQAPLNNDFHSTIPLNKNVGKDPVPQKKVLVNPASFSALNKSFDKYNNFNPAQLPESGVVVDKRTNEAYVMKDGKVQKRFPVLTGKNPDGKSSPDLEAFQLDDKQKVTPTGYYQMTKKGLEEWDTDPYKGNIQKLNGISAYGMPAPDASRLAIHETPFSVQGERGPLYRKSALDRAASSGCVNCEKPEMDYIQKQFPQGDTLMVIDSKDPKFQQISKKLSKKQEGGRLVKEIPKGYIPLEGKPNYYHNPQQSLELQQAKAGSIGGGADYDKFLQDAATKYPVEELVKKGYGTADGLAKFKGLYKATDDIVYTQNQAPNVVPASAQRGQPVYNSNKHIAAEIFYPSRNSSNVPDAGTLNTATQPARLKFRNDFGFTGEEVDIQGPDIQKYLGTTHTFANDGLYNELKSRNQVTKKLQMGGLAIPERPDLTIGQAQPSQEALNFQPNLLPGQTTEQKDRRDLSFVPLFANSVAQALATRVHNNRENNYIQSNLANPLNYIPQTNNTNSYVTQGQQTFQEGGEVDEDFEDMQDEEFLFEESSPEQVTPETVTPESAPVVSEEENIELEDDGFNPATAGTEGLDDEIPAGTAPRVDVSALVLRRPSKSVDEEIAAVESGGNYRAQNPNSSAVGKYQFLWNSWKPAIQKVTGVSSKEDFRNNPEAQENFYGWYKQNQMMPAIDRLKRYNSKGLSEGELAKLFHFKGEGGAMKYLTRGVDDTKQNNISIEKYLGRK